MACPVVAAIGEIRGGWDSWDNEDTGLIKINGVEYICANTLFYLTIRKMEYARRKLNGLDTKAFFASICGMPQTNVFATLEALLLRAVDAQYRSMLLALYNTIARINTAVINAAYRKKNPPIMPVFEPAGANNIIEAVNECVEYLNGSRLVDITALPPASQSTTPTSELNPSDSAETLMSAEEEILRGVGRREVEYAAAINKLTECITGCKKILTDLYT